MEDEKLLPLGEPTLHFPPGEDTIPSSSHFHLENKLNPAPSVQPQASVAPKPVLPPPLPPAPMNFPVGAISGTPSPKAQQWGVLISIVIIVLMIIIGAFYAWGQRIAQNQVPAATVQ